MKREDKTMKNRLAIIAACLAAPAALGADVTEIYFNDFEGSRVGGEWTKTTLTQHHAFSGFLGRFNRDTVTLRLDRPEPPTASRVVPDAGDPNQGGDPGDPDPDRPRPDPYHVFNVTFDLYLIDSWDGNDPVYGPDTFSVVANGQTLFHEYLSNWAHLPNFRPPDVGPVNLGFDSRWPDSIYRGLSFDFTLPEDAAEIVIHFIGNPNQPINDESWGIDNVSVSYRTVPTPGAAGLLALGGILIAGRRRQAR